MAAGKVADTFCFWTNKGGVGKTTMCFHSATSYALTHPDELVIVVDCDSQANISTTILTQVEIDWNPDVNREGREGTDVVNEMQSTMINGQFPRTLLGFFMSQYVRGTQGLKPAELLIEADEHNSNMPENLKLLCGDLRLQSTASQIQTCSMMPPYMIPSWVRERQHLKHFLENAAKEDGRKTVVFIDTTPVLDVFTEIALMTSTKLIVPVTADDYSTAALRNIVYLLYGIGCSSDPIISEFEKEMFWSKAQEHTRHCQVPKIHSVIFNQCKSTDGRLVQAQDRTWKMQCEVLMQCATSAVNAGKTIGDIFSLGGRPAPDSAEKMGKLIACHMADMVSSGIICMRCGLPIWMLMRNRKGAAQKMNMSHAAVSTSEQTTLKQLLGKNDMVELRDADYHLKLQPVLGSLIRPETLSTGVVNKALKEAKISSKKAWGNKRKREEE